MADARSFGPVADQMAEALQRYSKDELIDLLTHIVKTYVVEGTLPLKPEVGTHSGDEHLANLSFPQLILHHQMRLDHREWQLFSVSGEDVWVTIGGTRLNLTERPGAFPAPEATEGYMEPMGGPRRRPAPPAQAAGGPDAAATERRDERPAPAGSRAEPARPPTPDAVPPEPSRPTAEQGGEAQRVIETSNEDIEASERFGMLEFD